jgi:A/G-specific adenine glycosylase
MGVPMIAARAAAIRRRLLAWWDGARRDLPWRFAPGSVDPYRVWISEAMLQQTQVATVIPYYRRFLERFPSLERLAAAEEDEVLAAWSGLGYYTRARSLLRAAREAVERHGALPRRLEDLRRLPGFGPYTAGAVASIAFDVPTPAVDGNAARVLARLFLVAGRPGGRRFTERVWGLATALVSGIGGKGPRSAASRPGDLNQALIELGALVCRPRAPHCERCPLEASCRARAAGRERSIPGARRRISSPRLTLAVGICRARGRVLLVRRPSRGLFAGMWSPPAVELPDGADGARTISTVIRRDLSAQTGEFVLVGTVERALTHRRLVLHVYAARLRRLPPRREGWRMAGPRELESLAVPEAMRHALARAE